ncbi:MAG TPA: glycosyltransferase [Solirubrobacteraceae bacterium]|nr:glycosyltransferase [Solirubrobacteraceae bacterium]
MAVARELRARGAAVEFIGAGRAEAELVPAEHLPLHSISATGLSRSDPREALRGALLAARATRASRRILRGIDPDAVLGAGGYVAGPVGVAALSLRIPLVLMEADGHLGLTNRLLAPFARRVCLPFALAGHAHGRYVVTGRPVEPPFTDRPAARAEFAIPAGATCVLVFGGSLGARSINLAALEAFRDCELHVLHVCGGRDYAELRERPLRAGYDLREYLPRERFARALAAADIVVARSGGSVFELAANGLPAVLVPYPHATGDHQSENAARFAAAGAAVVIDDGELNAARLRDTVDGLVGDPARLRAMAAASRALARPEAAADVAAEVLKAAGR